MTGKLVTADSAAAPPAAVPPPPHILDWIDSYRVFLLPDRLRPETVASLPGWIEWARANCAPAGKEDIAKLFKLLSIALPPQFGMREAKALPLYIRNLGDIPALALEPTLDDLLRSMTHFPTIAHIREAARPHTAVFYTRLHRLRKLLAADAEAEARGPKWTLREVWDGIR